MANSNRNPKELKDLIEKTKLIDPLVWIKDDSITKSINSKDHDVCNARIEEQARLIHFYKQRGDDYLRKVQSLEKLNQYLADQKPFKFFRIESRFAEKMFNPKNKFISLFY